MYKKILAGLFILGLGLFVGRGLLQNGKVEKQKAFKASGEKFIVYKTPNCGCCVGYISYLRENGIEVDMEEVDDLSSIKEENDIPYDMQSCHTSLVGDYFVEGHVPLEAVDALLTQKPKVDGITLPGMPAGSPGMPGVKREDFLIYSLNEGESTEFLRI